MDFLGGDNCLVQNVLELIEMSARSWWRNCEPDAETFTIEALEDSIGPLDDQTMKHWLAASLEKTIRLQLVL